MEEVDSDGTVIDSFLAWCFEVGPGLEQDETATYYNSGFLDGTQRENVLRVFNSNKETYDLILIDINENRATGAAFQLAIWEALYEEHDTLTLVDGTHSSSDYTSTTSTPLGATAEGFLSKANNYDGPQHYALMEYSIEGNQNIGSVGAIPLPAAAWLLMFASGGLIAAKRRSARRDA